MSIDLISIERQCESEPSAVDINVGDLLVAYLEQLKVEYVFGIPGGAIEPLYNALARSARRGGPKAIIARHETGAAFMADAYARNTGRLGVCCSTTGPGATNMLTGVASSFENSTPLLVITPQTSLNKFGRKAMQESGDTGIDLVGMYQFCTRYSTLVSHVEQFEHKLVSAIMTAFSSPSGPTHISIPSDILHAKVAAGPSYNIHKLLQRPMMQDDFSVNELIKLLTASKKTVFVLGVGAREAASQVIDVALALKATILTTPDGKSFISPYHPQFRGVIGFAGHRSANKALSDPAVDTVVVVGASLGEFTSNAWDTGAMLNNRLIHVDELEANFTRSPMAKLHVRGRIATIFEHVIASLAEREQKQKVIALIEDHQRSRPTSIENNRKDSSENMHFELDDPRKIFDDSIPIKPQWLMHQLTQIFPVNTRFLADTGNNLAWAIHYLNPFDRRVGQRRQLSRWNSEQHRYDYGRRQRSNALFQVCAEFCSMGWSPGSAIGTALANPGEPVVCIVGDGSFLMSGNEITVALQEKLSVIFLVLNDTSLGMVKHGQILNESESIGHYLPKVNFSALAEAMGIPGYKVTTPKELKALNIDVICHRAGPTLIEVIIDPDEVPPIATRIKGMN
ncbi:MAG: thiamine pyrophosphate-binding protein [Pseudomonadales bacterium]|nr:thiamine pyrophosphate-binding protein [Pseudomonadales bacterium]MCP5216306.1 thiamine pyrophosphate-binding protein [Pseudomonadales bacterium]